MTPLERALGNWLAVLAEVADVGDRAELGMTTASTVVGAVRLEEWCHWMATQPLEVVLREQIGAIEACIWMAHADRTIAKEEREMIGRLVDDSALDDDAKAPVLAAVDAAREPADLAQRVTHPVLRELLLSLAWRMARADRNIAPQEITRYEELAAALGIEAKRAERLRGA